ncbi:MAG: DUF1724 domain-containing protein [Candidatus Bathyarchaeota archaeon]|nr:DUF1724 domain-containing protein [Candidatus Bathyarchaeota archaeon]
MPLKELCGLLFELSNEDRLNILFELKKNPMKLSRVSERFDFTVPETARNLSRLTASNLITKDSEGFFHLTPFGEVAVRLVPSFHFLSKNQKYFKTHSLSTVPDELCAGIGALANSKLVNEPLTSIFLCEKMIREAQSYIWVLVDEILANAVPLGANAVSRGVEFLKLMPRNAQIPPDILALTNDKVFEQGARAKKVESRYLDDVNKLPVFLFLSEKELALVSFPNLEGKIDYTGFTSQDEAALNWAKVVFMHYWNQAKH